MNTAISTTPVRPEVPRTLALSQWQSGPSTRFLRFFAAPVLILAGLAGWPASLGAQSVYPLRPDDPRAVYVDKATFDVHADGVGDDAEALQQAINRVADTTRLGVVFIPEGRYRLGKTVYVWQGIRLIGYGKQRPVFLLGRNTPGFAEGSSRYMVHFADNRPRMGGPLVDASEFTFYSGMSNIDFAIEEGNPAAVAVRFRVAQHGVLTHMDFRLGSARAALEDIGNQASDIHVHGGQYGIFTKKTSPNWQFLLMDSSFDGQSVAAIHTQEVGFTLLRVRFARMPVALEIAPGEVEQLYGKDLQMDGVRTAALVLGNAQNVRSEVNLLNVACHDVPHFVQGEKPIAAPGRDYVEERFSAGLEIGEDGREKGIVLRHRERALEQPAARPPSDVPALPPMSKWVNVRSLGVKGDGTTDDTAALQNAIAKEPILYLPSGTYRVTNTLKMRPDTVLIGFNPGNTQLSLPNGAAAFQGEGPAMPVLLVPKGGTNIVVGLGIASGSGNPRAAGIVWMAGRTSLLDDTTFPSRGSGKGSQNPDLLIREGGGIFRGLWTHSTISNAGLRVENTSIPSRIYQLSNEHHKRVEVQFHNVQNWEVYALQTEEENPAGAEAIALEIEDSKHLLFANTYMYRVSRNVLPKTYAVVVRNSDDIRFENVKVFSQTRLAFDNAVVDENSGVAVRAHEFPSFTVEKGMKAPAPLPLPAVFDARAKLEKLAGGFSNASGLTTDAAGHLYFTDAAQRKIYRWNETQKKAEVLAETQGQPMVMAWVRPSTLIYVVNEKAVYGINLAEPAAPQKITETADRVPQTKLLLPVGLHNSLQVLMDLLEHRGYVYRQGSNTAIVSVVPNEHRGYFYAPGTTTAIMVGGTWRPILQCSTLAAFAPGEQHLLVSEDDARTYLAKVDEAGKLTTSVFAERGGTSVARDTAGNVYIASGQIYIHNRDGKAIGMLELPERPGSLAFGGPDRRTLFIGARGSLYAIRTVAPGE